jgi:hypothetical protein
MVVTSIEAERSENLFHVSMGLILEWHAQYVWVARPESSKGVLAHATPFEDSGRATGQASRNWSGHGSRDLSYGFASFFSFDARRRRTCRKVKSGRIFGEAAMRMLGAGAVTLALLLGLSPAFAASDDGPGGDDNSKGQSGGSWLSRWLAPPAKTPEKPPIPKDVKKIQTDKDDHGKGPTSMEEAAAYRAREQAKYFRRSSVCDKLKEIADATNNPALRKRAEELDARAWDVYTQRTARLPSSGVQFESDSKTLEKHFKDVPRVRQPNSETPVYTVPGEKAKEPVREESR